jgi:hypothetical protein
MIRRLAISAVFVVLAAVSSAGASEGFDDLVALVKSGVTQDVVLAYVEASPVAYQLTVDEILYLNDIGVSADVIQAVMKRGEAVRQAAPAAPGIAPPAPPPGEVQAPVEPAAPAADVQEPVIGKPPPEAAPAVPASEPVIGPAPPAQPAPVTEVIREREIIRERVVEPAPTVVYVSRPSTLVMAPPEGGVTISYFYDSLSPYGSWIMVDGTWLWQPTVVLTDRSWRPYCHRGRWVWTDWGWAWHSDYSWGWAPFHYGRWTCHPRHGWMWAPDTVWGPAWVHWRASDAHYAWAPLPPAARYETGIGFSYHGKHVNVGFHFGLVERDYAFVPVQRFCEPVLTPHMLPPTHVTNVYNNTTIIQNNYTYNDNRIINTGPGVERYERVTKQRVQVTKIADAQVKPGQQIRGETLSKNAFTVYRPKVQATVPETPPQVLQRRQELAKKQELARVAAEARRDTRETKQDARQAAPALQAAQNKQEAAVRKAQDAAEDAARKARQEALEKVRKDATALRKREQDAEHDAAAAKRDEARREAQAKQDAQEAQRKEKTAAEAAAREQARREAKAREDAEDAAKKAERDAKKQREAAEAVAREQARRDAKAREDAQARDAAADAQRKAAAEAAAREQARRDVEARPPVTTPRQETIVTQPQPRVTQPAPDTGATARETARQEARARQDAAEAQRKAEAEARRQARQQPAPTPAPGATTRDTEPDTTKRKSSTRDTEDGIGRRY